MEDKRLIDDLKALVLRLYEEHNPAKLGEVDGLFEKYAGVERDMYARICRKYGVEPDPDFATPLPPAVNGSSGGASGGSARIITEQEEAQAVARHLRHAMRHVPWLRGSSPEVMQELLKLRKFALELLGWCAGKPVGVLPSAAAIAIRALRQLLVDLGALGELRLDLGDSTECEQIPAPAEEPWLPAKHHPAAPDKAGQQGHGLGPQAENRIANWMRDPLRELRNWVLRELRKQHGQPLKLNRLNDMLWELLRDLSAESHEGWERLEDLVIDRGFVESNCDVLRVVGGDAVTLADVDALQSGSAGRRSRSRSPVAPLRCRQASAHATTAQGAGGPLRWDAPPLEECEARGAEQDHGRPSSDRRGVWEAGPDVEASAEAAPGAVGARVAPPPLRPFQARPARGTVGALWQSSDRGPTSGAPPAGSPPPPPRPLRPPVRPALIPGGQGWPSRGNEEEEEQEGEKRPSWRPRSWGEPSSDACGGGPAPPGPPIRPAWRPRSWGVAAQGPTHESGVPSWQSPGTAAPAKASQSYPRRWL